MKVKMCPYCLSTKISYEAGMMTGQKYRCNKCGYVGSLILEKDMTEEELKSEDR